MNEQIENCPCSGKNSSNFAAPWILLTLYGNQGMHGYALAEIIGKRLETLGVGLNIAGVYRHLAALEKRGMLISEVDESGNGAARKTFCLTGSGLACLRNWLLTMQSQASIIEAFLNRRKKHCLPIFSFP